MDISTNLSTVSRDSGFYIVDFESVEFDLEPSAKVFGPFSNTRSLGSIC